MKDEQRLRETAERAVSARHRLEQVIRYERSQGASLRQLASVTGLSHETVRRIVSLTS